MFQPSPPPDGPRPSLPGDPAEAPRPAPGRRPGSRAPALLLGWLTLIGVPAIARQATTPDPTDPRPVVDARGHSGEIRELLFHQDDEGTLLLLSAGEDKVVRVWNLTDGRPSLSRTLRPRLYRGQAGAIFAMARSAPDDDGQSLLAVAGYGVRANPGEITLFRFPGVEDPGTGDVVTVLPEGYRNLRISPGGPAGHFNLVNDLEFLPGSRRFLASASSDGTVRLWDLQDLQAPKTSVVLRDDRAITDPRDLLEGDSPHVVEIAFSPDGTRLISCSSFDDSREQVGTIRLWDVSEPTRPRLIQAVRNPQRSGRSGGAFTQPHCLAFSPDGRWAFIGQENGLLLRFDVTDAGLANRVVCSTGADQGPIEALSCVEAEGLPGPRLLTSIIEGDFPDQSTLPPLDCRIELRDASDPLAPAVEIGRTRGRVRACAVTPDGRFAVVAGGDRQRITLLPLDRAAPAEGPAIDRRPITLSGLGGAIWDLRWSEDSGTIAFSRARPGAPGDSPRYEGFRLDGDFERDPDRLGPIEPRDAPRGPVATAQGGRLVVRPFSTYVVAVGLPGFDPRNPDPSRLWAAIRLDPSRDGRWWSYSVLPDPTGNRSEVIAVGCDFGVRIFGIPEQGEQCPRLRALEGHSGPVLAMAPSPDGRWLATGSADQTIRLWSLAEADRPPPLGAGLRSLSPDGRSLPWKVESVAAGSFAAKAGLRPGDRITVAGLGGRPLDDVTRVIEAKAGDRLDFQVERDGEGAEPVILQLGTSKRDQPDLSIFPAEDGEWIAWTEPGYYQTSIEGDSRYLVWHRNRSTQGGRTDAAPFRAYEDRFRRPAVLTRLIQTASLPDALGQALVRPSPLFNDPGDDRPLQTPPQPDEPKPEEPKPDEPNQVPVATTPPPWPEVWVAPIIGGGSSPVPDAELVSPDPELRLELTVAAPSTQDFGAESLPIRRVRVFADTYLVQEIEVGPDDLPLERVGEAQAIPVPLIPGRQTIWVELEDLEGNRTPRGRSFSVSFEPRTPDEPRAWVVSLGIERFGSSAFSPIRFAEDDAREVLNSIADRCASDGFEGDRIHPLPLLVGEDATAGGLANALSGILESPSGPGPARGDSVFVFVNSHFIDFGGDRGSRLLGVDADAGADEASGTGMIAAAELSRTLGEMVAQGCRVVLLLDAVHPETPPSRRPNALMEWVRDLIARRRVVVVLASNSGPSFYDGSSGHGVFARGLLALLDGETADALPYRYQDDGSPPILTIGDLAELLPIAVKAENDRQQVGIYLPDLNPNNPAFGPPTPPEAVEVAAGGSD
ncbi:WD40 repeat domain-containing protein [Tautonia sociabilis]|uniref:WD40 repeat domain-containing protein n=1 Tax=Tautonia sociabilis TaxID=2080755 RepID=UPI0013157178|nr:hypothetical protein [Tautonia sociabilis]